MKHFQRLCNVDESGKAIIDEDTELMMDIAEEVIQLLRKHNLCAGEALQILRECDSIICRKCEEMPF